MRAPPNGSGTEHHHNVHIRSLISLFQAQDKENRRFSIIVPDKRRVLIQKPTPACKQKSSDNNIWRGYYY